MGASEGEQLELSAYRIDDKSDAALKLIHDLIDRSEITSELYAFRSRVKGKDGIIEKVRRKRTDAENPKPYYEPDDVTDVIGIRFITLFREDLIKTVANVLKMLKHEDEFRHSNPFKKNVIREAIIYLHDDPADPIPILNDIKELIKRAGCEPHIENPKSGYSSVHFVATCQFLKGGQSKDFPVEIQIRTVFEDAWGEIEHKVTYETKRADNPLSDGQKIAADHTRVLKSYVNGCVQYAELIRRLANADQVQVQERFNFLNDDSSDHKLLSLVDGADKETITHLLARSKRYQDAGDVPANEWLKLAEEFFILRERLFFDKNYLKSRQKIAYHLSMEEAFCLLETRIPQHAASALKIYHRVMADEDNVSPIVYYRAARANRILSRHEMAETFFSMCLEAVEPNPSKCENKWLPTAAIRQLGYLLWERANETPEDGGLEAYDRKLSFLDQAYKITTRCFEPKFLQTMHDTAKITTHNNALYYLVDALEVQKKLGASRPYTSSDLTKHVTPLEEWFSKIEVNTLGSQQWASLQTLMRTYGFLGDQSKLIKTAKIILRSMFNRIEMDGSRIDTVLSNQLIRYEEMEGALLSLSAADQKIFKQCFSVLNISATES